MTEPHLLTRRATPESWRRLGHPLGACLSAMLLFLLTTVPAYARPVVNAVNAAEDRTSPVPPPAHSARQSRTLLLCSGPQDESAPRPAVDRRRGCATPDGGPSNAVAGGAWANLRGEARPDVSVLSRDTQ